MVLRFKSAGQRRLNVAGRIYLLNENSDLLAMEESLYDSEKLLQEMLAQHPDLLAGEQINSEEPRRWLLITREMSVPGEEDGNSRWSLDHLFLDQDAVPTLVEVKRSTDTRIRREVIGQMLDYAANAVAYWPVEEIRAKYESRCEKREEDPEEVLMSFLGENHNSDVFWQRVKTNLQAGRVRLVFIADSIPAELRRVVEFLNEQMDPAEVLAIEVKQFVGRGMKTLVPRVLGQTETARQKKSSGSGRRDKIAEADFMAQAVTDRPEAEVKIVRQLIEWARRQGLDDNFRQGERGSAFIPALNHSGRFFYPVSVQLKGTIVIQMRWLKDRPPFNKADKRQELFHRIEQIPGLRVSDAAMEGYPKFPISSLIDDSRLLSFTATLDWLVNEIRATNAD